jgi:transcription elongation GreA/GreB family factor
MTADGLSELRSELDRLRGHDREEVRHRLRDARSYGHESDEVYALREEEMILEARIALLEETISRAVLVSAQAAAGAVTVGCAATVEDLATGQRSRHTIAGAHEPFSPGRVSAASPMGQKLIGAAPGAVVEVELPRGRSRRLRLTSIEALAQSECADSAEPAA